MTCKTNNSTPMPKSISNELKEVPNPAKVSPRIIEGKVFGIIETHQLKVLRSHFIMESIGNIEDDYQIQEEIGKGAYGVVYTALHKPTGDMRAIKVVQRKDGKYNHETSILKELVTNS